MAATVYFSDMRSSGKANLLDKMEKLVKKAGIEAAIAPGDLVAIKLHFGEPGNLSYIRPPFVRRMVQIIKKQKGKPFLTDAGTLYKGLRANAVDHLERDRKSVV